MGTSTYNETLSVEDPSTTGTFVEIGGIASLNPPQVNTDQVDVTTLNNGGWREYVPGLKDGGDGSIVVNPKPADPGQVILHGNVGKTLNFKLSTPLYDDPTKIDRWTFSATVNSPYPTPATASSPAAYTHTFPIRVTGEVDHSYSTVTP